jgi:hypothetical protein
MELSNRLKVKPLKEGQIKIFKLVGSGEIDPGTGQPRFNSGAHYEGYFTIHDKFEKDHTKRKKVLKNVTGTSTKVVDGKEVVEEVVSPIDFNGKGLRIVKEDEYNTLVCLMRANENASNPFRNPRVPALWEEVEPEKGRQQVMDLMDLQLAAEMYAKSADMKDVVALAKKLNETGDFVIILDKRDAGDIRFDMRKIARENPKEFMRYSKDKEMKIKILIEDAVSNLVISYDEDAKEWIWDEDSSLLLKVEAGKEPLKALCAFLDKDKEANDKLLEIVNESMRSHIEM